jgi:hypothetical protein
MVRSFQNDSYFVRSEGLMKKAGACLINTSNKSTPQWNDSDYGGKPDDFDAFSRLEQEAKNQPPAAPIESHPWIKSRHVPSYS